MEEKRVGGGLSGSTLKLIAIASMLVDHTAAVLLRGSPCYSLCRIIGRLAFPIFCFLLVEGYVHTHDVKKYGLRLLLFALLSELPFDLAFSMEAVNMGYQNVFFTLFIGLCMLYGLEHSEGRAMRLVVLLAGIMVAVAMKTDYSGMGVAAIAVLYLTRRNRLWQAAMGAIAFVWEWPAVAAFVPIYFYNGKRGISLKYLFYVFYPAHLLTLVLIRYFVQ